MANLPCHDFASDLDLDPTSRGCVWKDRGELAHGGRSAPNVALLQHHEAASGGGRCERGPKQLGRLALGQQDRRPLGDRQAALCLLKGLGDTAPEKGVHEGDAEVHRLQVVHRGGPIRHVPHAVGQQVPSQLLRAAHVQHHQGGPEHLHLAEARQRRVVHAGDVEHVAAQQGPLEGFQGRGHGGHVALADDALDQLQLLVQQWHRPCCQQEGVSTTESSQRLVPQLADAAGGASSGHAPSHD
mmetsp:Transcript_140057/g.447941  ORF Transcript_140057/g.447941 Transcript_140057/m.447941 type:complete len:242 (-) Transcript_140057:779-1504(-)